MRTEVKAGLVVGLIIIAGVVFYAVNRGGPGGTEADVIPFDVTVSDTGDDEAIDLAANRPSERPAVVTPKPAASPLVSSLRPASRPAIGPLVGAPSPTTAPAASPQTQPIDRTPVVVLPPRPSRSPEPEDRSATVRTTPKPKPATVRHTIEVGDTFSSIAREHYGEARYWTLIRDANPDADPRRLLEGQVILLPPRESEEESPSNATGSRPRSRPSGTTPKIDAATYVVGSGDTLTSIARNVLGDGSRWREIYDLNLDKLDNPDVLHEGVELRLPAREKPRS